MQSLVTSNLSVLQLTALLHATVYSDYRHGPVDSTEGGCTNEEPGTATSEDVTVLDPEPPGTSYNTVSLPVDQDLAEEPTTDTAECNAPCCRDAVESFQVSDQAVLQKTRKLQGHARQFCTEWFKGRPWLVLCMTKMKAFCNFCRYCAKRDILIDKQGDAAFIDTGYDNWKPVCTSFLKHLTCYFCIMCTHF